MMKAGELEMIRPPTPEPATLTLLDSFGHKFQPMADRKVTLACDRTTPLAALMANTRRFRGKRVGFSLTKMKFVDDEPDFFGRRNEFSAFPVLVGALLYL